jgi:hypothetical protein
MGEQASSRKGIALSLCGGMESIFERPRIAAQVRGLGARDQMLRLIADSITNGVYFHDYGGVACHHGFCAALTLEDVDEILQRLNKAVGIIPQEESCA